MHPVKSSGKDVDEFDFIGIIDYENNERVLQPIEPISRGRFRLKCLTMHDQYNVKRVLLAGMKGHIFKLALLKEGPVHCCECVHKGKLKHTVMIEFPRSIVQELEQAVANAHRQSRTAQK